MQDPNSSSQDASNQEPKWDYTTNSQNMLTGAMVVAGNLLVIVLYILYSNVPAVHQFISGKPL